MAVTGWTYKRKFYPFGSELPKELKDSIKARGLDEMTGQPLQPQAEAQPEAQHPIDGLVEDQAEADNKPAAKTKQTGKGK